MTPKIELMLLVLDELADYIKEGGDAEMALFHYNQIKRMFDQRPPVNPVFIPVNKMLLDGRFQQLVRQHISGWKEHVYKFNFEDFVKASARLTDLVETLQEEGIAVQSVLEAMKDTRDLFSEDSTEGV